jgi:hypothetical protein
LRCPGTGTETNPIFIAAVIYAGDLVVGPVALSSAPNVVRIAFVNFYFAITVRSVDITVRGHPVVGIEADQLSDYYSC